MSTRWFRSDDPFDPAWHLQDTGQVAVCGARAHPGVPWLDDMPRFGVLCADCDD